MALRPRTKKSSLAFMGEGWEQAYIESRMMVGQDQETLDGIQSNKDMTPHQQGAAILKLFFVSGKGISADGELADMTLEDIDGLDIFTIGELAGEVGMPDPKASESLIPISTDQDQLPDDTSNSSTENALA